MPGLTIAVSEHQAELSSHPEQQSLNNGSLPEFGPTSTKIILYLPPRLSSLPDPYLALQGPPLHQPVTTETRLPDIDPASLSLHRALHHFKPVDDQYAARPYPEAFNWQELILPVDDEREWYCVAFRSVRRQRIDNMSLYDADRRAHEEAVQHGGLIMYWYGVPSPETGANLATCIWQSRQHAVMANTRREHIQAARLVQIAYETYVLERWVIRKIKGETGISLEKYTEGPVGW